MTHEVFHSIDTTPLDEMAATCHKLLEADPRCIEARRSLSKVHYAKGVTILTEVSQRFGGTAVTPALLDNLYQTWSLGLLSRGDLPDDSDVVVLCLRLGEIDMVRGHTENGKRHLERAISNLHLVSGEHVPDVLQHLPQALRAITPPDDLKTKLSLVYLHWAYHLLGVAHLEKSVEGCARVIEAFEQAFGADPEGDLAEQLEGYFQASLVHFSSGTIDQCISTIERALALQRKKTEKHPLCESGIRFFQTRTASLAGIGQLMNEHEFFVKTGAIGWRPPYKGVLLAPVGEVCNRAALDYWRRYNCVVTDPSLIKRLTPLREHLEFNTFWFRMPDGTLQYLWGGMIAIQREWEQRGREPLLALLPRHRREGRQILESLGLPRGAWFISLHVREQTELRDGKRVPTYNSHRDARIDTYDRAIDEIVRRGGWVVRLGDATMSALPPRHGVIDYALSDAKSDWMDLYCVAESRFFLGTASGVNGIPISFGIPSLLTNMSPTNIFGVCSHDIYLPKVMRSLATGKLLSFRESLKAPFNYLFHSEGYRTYGVEVVDNSADELAEAVAEMLDRALGTATYTDDDERLQKHFRGIARDSLPCPLESRIGRDFLRRYQHLLD